MEQYELPPRFANRELFYAIEHYAPKHVFIRLMGSLGGTIKVNQSLEGKLFEVQQKEKGLSVLVNKKEVFLYEQLPSEEGGRGFSIAYRRNPDRNGVIPALPTGLNPDDPELPAVHTSMFRGANSDHLMEISFEGKIPLRFHSWWVKRRFKYWHIKGKYQR